MDDNQTTNHTMSHLIQMLTETGLPFAYGHFAEGESPEPPFLVFTLPGSKHIAADGGVYVKIETVHIELYTDEKNPETEALIEKMFDDHGIYYDKEAEVWIASERLYEVLYSFIRNASGMDAGEEREEPNAEYLSL